MSGPAFFVWVGKDGRDLPSDSKWLTMQASEGNPKHTCMLWAIFTCLKVKGCELISAWKEKSEPKAEKGDFVDSAVNVPRVENIISSSCCSLEHVPVVQMLFKCYTLPISCSLLSAPMPLTFFCLNSTLSLPIYMTASAIEPAVMLLIVLKTENGLLHVFVFNLLQCD